jgi:hypothetical protein
VSSDDSAFGAGVADVARVELALAGCPCVDPDASAAAGSCVLHTSSGERVANASIAEGEGDAAD